MKQINNIFLLALCALFLFSCKSQDIKKTGEADPVSLLHSTAEEAADALLTEGYKTLAGRLPLQEQIHEAWGYQRMKDEGGALLYFVASSRSKAKDYNIARLQAETLAKVQLAGHVETRIGQLVENKMASHHLMGGEEHVKEILDQSKSLVKTSLSQLIPLLEVFKEYPDGEVEVMLMIACRRDQADRIMNEID